MAAHPERLIVTALILLALTAAGSASPAATVWLKPDAAGKTIVRLKLDTRKTTVRLKPDATGNTTVRLEPDAAGKAAFDVAASNVASAFRRTAGAQSSRPAAPRTAAKRIISLVPNLTEALYAIGAGPQVIAVSSYDEFPPEVKSLPHVGALLDPDTERILSLRPDLVITYGSQAELESQFARAGIRSYSYRNGGIAIITKSIRELGMLTGHTDGAERLVRDLETQLNAVRAKVRGLPRLRTVLVFGREPSALRQLYVSGGVGFLHEMLEIAGGTNVFADVHRESVQPSRETLLVRAPEAILEVHAGAAPPADSVRQERDTWRALASVPAVQQSRIYLLYGDHLVVPGPRIGRATEEFARALHPEAFR